MLSEKVMNSAPQLSLSSYIVNAITINTYVAKSFGVCSNINPEYAMNILRKIRVRNVNRVIIGTLNTNFCSTNLIN